MSSDRHESGKDELALKILAYLDDHPYAGDTLEGIVQWWLLDRKIKNQIKLVNESLVQLLTENFIVEEKKPATGNVYRINPHKQEEIQKILRSGNLRK